MRRIGLAILLAAACCETRADDALDKAWQALFSQDDPAAAAQQIEAVLAACDHNVETLKARIAADTTYPAMKPAWHRRTTRVQAGAKAYDVEFIVRVPDGYTPRKSWPLLLLAHGQGSNGGHILGAFDARLGAAIERFIVVAPTLPGPQGFNARKYQQDSYLKPLAWARVHLNVDDDRIHLSGYSQGAHLVWNLSTMFPYHFAAALPLAGAPIYEGWPATGTAYLQNLWNLPVWAMWGEKDTPGPPKQGNADLCRVATARLKALKVETYRGTELKGKAHGGCWPAGREMADFFRRHKRTAVPGKYWHYFHLAHHSRSYYVAATEFGHPPFDFEKGAEISIPAGTKPTREALTKLYEKKVRAAIFRIYAALDRPRNALRIQPMGLRAVRLYVMEGMFRLAQPVRLTYFSRSWRGRIAPSAKCMLTHYAATRDATALVCNEIDLPARGTAAARYK